MIFWTYVFVYLTPTVACKTVKCYKNDLIFFKRIHSSTFHYFNLYWRRESFLIHSVFFRFHKKSVLRCLFGEFIKLINYSFINNGISVKSKDCNNQILAISTQRRIQGRYFNLHNIRVRSQIRCESISNSF